MIKFAIVTGSSGGIGKAIVSRFIDDGYTVLGIDQNKSDISSSLHFFIKCDLNSYVKNIDYMNQINADIKEVIPKNLSKLVLINNAAVQILKPMSEIKYKNFKDSYVINSMAPFFISQGLFENLKEADGHIINISSIHSKLTKSNFTAYAASKAALESITRSMAIELSRFGISVNAISPAAINTNMLKEGFIDNPKAIINLKKSHPSNTIGEPKALAKLIKNIVEDNSIFLTGSIIDFSGGISAILNDPENLS